MICGVAPLLQGESTMAGQITKSVVDRLAARESEYTVWDFKLPGFGVRVRPTERERRENSERRAVLH